MIIYKHIYLRLLVLTLLMLTCFSINAQKKKEEARIPKAQLHRTQAHPIKMDTLSLDSVIHADNRQIRQDSVLTESAVKSTSDTLNAATILDTLKVVNELVSSVTEKGIKDKAPKVFVPDPHTSLWMAIVFPGGGQIYNRKYWKLPLIYGGFLGCAYAINWNNTMYQDYSQAYIDIMDDDPTTRSYEDFLPKNYDLNANMQRIQDLLKRKKNYYRRYRDLSIFCMIGVYALSIIDAYVDAELSSFDISKDLSMKVRPSIINNNNSLAIHNPYPTQSYGIQCSLNF